jgi:hypothetical protein
VISINFGLQGAVHVRFVVAKWHWDRFASEYFSLPLSVAFQQYAVLIFQTTGEHEEGKTLPLFFLNLKKVHFQGHPELLRFILWGM